MFLADSDLERINICRDLSDNKFIELGLSSRADFLVTGDDDLLVLKEVRGLKIITPADLGKLIDRD